MSSQLPILSYQEIEQELQGFEQQERQRLGLAAAAEQQWRDLNPQVFRRQDRGETTLLIGGLTMAHDCLMQAALQGLDYKVQLLDCPDTKALHLGKEFGNRGQCNPTYFTVGNLIKHLVHLRDVEGLSVEQIVRSYVFVTAGSCGPCRFGTYVTEYRKALRDSGFDGFRVLLFQQNGGLKQATGDASGLEITPTFFLQFMKAMLAGDVLNAMGYRIRPYETVSGATDAAMEQAKQEVAGALRKRRSVVLAMRRARKFFRSVAVDRSRPAPKVMVIGEFWAMTTEGDGNYRLQRFLEQEGAEVEVQTITAWVLYLIWLVLHDSRNRARLTADDHAGEGLRGVNLWVRLGSLHAADRLLRVMFHTFARAVGLRGVKLPDMQKIADYAKAHYDVELRGGEGHMEVGKLIEAIQKQKAHMVVSVKPFGCMPSSGVSDGVQAAVMAQNPGAIFCPVETTGDAAVNFQSRVQMFLFKARQKAREELQTALDTRGLTMDQFQERAGRGGCATLAYPKHRYAGTASNQVFEI